MASQTKSAFATEGTQYGLDSSYYLLDTVPGPGAVLQGPITITGNLTTTGTTTSQGNLSAPAVATSNVTSAATLSLTASAGNVNINAQGGSNVSLVGQNLVAPMLGGVSITSGATPGSTFTMVPDGTINLNGAGAGSSVRIEALSSSIPGALRSTLLLPASGNASLTGIGNLEIFGGNSTNIVTPDLATTGALITINPKTGQGAPGFPLPVVVDAPTVYYAMTSNKLFARLTGSTLGAAYIRLPLNFNSPQQPPFVFVTDANGVLRSNAFSAGGLFYSGTPAPGSGLTPNSWYWQQSYLGADYIFNILVL